MQKFYIDFKVTNQHIVAITKTKIVADSKNLLFAKFDFRTSEWDGITKTALFRHNNEAIKVILVDDECEIPWEVIKTGNVTVSVFAGDLVTSDTTVIKIYESGYGDGGEPEPPTPTEYQQIITMLDNISEQMDSTVTEKIDDYFEEHPVVTTEECEAIVEDAIKDKADKSDIPSLVGYATESWVESKNYLTEHQPIKTVNGQSLIGTGNIVVSSLPDFTAADEGKVLGIVNGALAWVDGGTPTPTPPGPTPPPEPEVPD